MSPSSEEWHRMHRAIFGIEGSEKDIGLLRRYDRLETKLDTSWRAVCIFGSVGIALCMAILALLSYLGTHRSTSLVNVPVIRETIPADASN